MATAGMLSRTKSLVRPLYRRLTRAGIPTHQPTVIRSFAHDPSAFTQGLVVCDGYLYESTGTTEGSSVRRLDLRTGHILQKVSLAGVWAEGLTAMGDTLTVLTWQHERATVLSRPDLQEVGTLRYSGEGWGLASDGRQYVMTDGTSVITKRDAQFTAVGRLRVRMNGLPVMRLNDLEIVGDTIYANVWYSTDILAISAATGVVTAIIDCSQLAAIAAVTTPDGVLNGIAHDPHTGSFYLTGKYWPVVFEVRI